MNTSPKIIQVHYLSMLKMLFNLLKKAYRKFETLLPNQLESSFVRHNKRVFTRTTAKCSNSPVVLMEMNLLHSSHISYSYLANVLAQENNARIIGYYPYKLSPLRGLYFSFCKFFKLDTFSIYSSFCAVDFLKVEITDLQRIKALRIFDEILSQLDNNRYIETIKINGVWIGDLIYDTYLRLFNQPTIDKTNAGFRNFLLESIELFLFWEHYLDSHHVCAINVSHCVYNLAIPLRLCVERNIPAFQASAAHVYHLSKKNFFAYSDFYYFRERFADLPEEVKIQGIAEAKRRIERRFSGEVGVDMAYSSKSAYKAFLNDRLLTQSSKKKILIATHCFYDSPHSYGNNIFPDFYEWLDFLGVISNETDYDWYIKVHPDYLPGTMKIIEDFISRYSKFALLPANASHHQIIAEGIDVALTTYGTIAFEYAALGIPVINCSVCNPHIAYNFNLHPASVESYRLLLNQLDTLQFSIDKQQVYEYYFMKYIFNTDNIFFTNLSKTVEEIGGYSKLSTPFIYERWLHEWTSDRHKSIVSALQVFIRSGDFRLEYHHYDHDFFLKSN